VNRFLVNRLLTSSSNGRGGGGGSLTTGIPHHHLWTTAHELKSPVWRDQISATLAEKPGQGFSAKSGQGGKKRRDDSF